MLLPPGAEKIKAVGSASVILEMLPEEFESSFSVSTNGEAAGASLIPLT